MLQDLFVGPALKTFRALQLEYSIPQSEHYLVKHSKQVTSLPWQIPQYYLTNNMKTKGTSVIYKHLHNKQELIKSPHIRVWKRDFGREYLKDQWQRALSTTYSSRECQIM